MNCLFCLTVLTRVTCSPVRLRDRAPLTNAGEAPSTEGARAPYSILNGSHRVYKKRLLSKKQPIPNRHKPTIPRRIQYLQSLFDLYILLVYLLVDYRNIVKNVRNYQLLYKWKNHCFSRGQFLRLLDYTTHNIYKLEIN